MRVTLARMGHDDALPLPQPDQFTTLLSNLLAAHRQMIEGDAESEREYEELRERIIDVYARAYQGGRPEGRCIGLMPAPGPGRGDRLRA